MQATFIKLNEIFSHFLLIIDPLDNLLSKTARKLYQEFIKTSLIEEGNRILVSYERLENSLGYCHNTIRKGVLELERANLIKRSRSIGGDSFFVELNRDFFDDSLNRSIKKLGK